MNLIQIIDKEGKSLTSQFNFLLFISTHVEENIDIPSDIRVDRSLKQKDKYTISYIIGYLSSEVPPLWENTDEMSFQTAVYYLLNMRQITNKAALLSDIISECISEYNEE